MRALCKGLLVLSLILAAPLVSAEAGRVLFVSGEAALIRGGQLPIAKGTIVESGDTIVTGGDGRVQLLMEDGDRIALRPNTRFTIEDFRPVRGEQTAAAGEPRKSGWRSFYALARGGFRTLTQSHGQRDENSYRVRTPVATIGIRGTDYSAYLNDDEPGGSPALYLGVSDGAASLTNSAGQLVLGNDQYGMVASSNSEPQPLEGPPPFMQDSEGPSGEGEWEEEVEEEGDGYSARRSPPAEEGGEPDEPSGDGITGEANDVSEYEYEETSLIIGGTDSSGNPVDLTGGGATSGGGGGGGGSSQGAGVAFATGPVNPAQLSGSAFNPAGSFSKDGSGNLTAFDGPYVSGNARYAIGSASNVDTGTDSQTGLRWGRWAGGNAAITPAGGSASALDLSNRSLHWITGPQTDQAPALPTSGTLHYTLVGNTNPTDNHGNVGALGYAHFSADFDNQSVSSSVGVNINNQTWDAYGSGSFGTNGTFNGGYDSVTITDNNGCGSGCSGSGSFGGFFTDGAEGAGLGFAMEDGNGTTVSGAAAFGDPQSGCGNCVLQTE